MLIGDIHSTLLVLIKLGCEIKSRLEALNQAAEDLQLLTANLQLLVTVFENPANETILAAHVAEFVAILDILESIAKSCTKCAKALEVDSARAPPAHDTIEAFGRKMIRRIWILNRIPSLLAEIQHKAEHLQKVYSAVSIVILQDLRANQSQSSPGTELARDSTLVGRGSNYADLNGLDFTTNFASIDLILGNLMNECKSLRQQLHESVIRPDASATEHYQQQNPEGMTFWRDRFQKKELGPSSLRYETLYVSWARFVHEVETSFTLNNIPTGVFETGNIDALRELGRRYSIDLRGARRLSTVRPLWLPALQTALDPLHRGYVKPQDYFTLLSNSSLSETLRRLALENSGYGILVECERAASDLSLPASIESPADHVGWIAAQIVAVPTPEELGVTTEREIMETSGGKLLSCFNDTARDVYVHVRYLQTGQIERKSLLRHVRPIGGISVGASISIRYDLDAGKHAWGSDSTITEYHARYGGEYNITAGSGRNASLFSTHPIAGSFDDVLRDQVHAKDSTLPRHGYAILGPSKTFSVAPNVGERIQIEHEGLWYDSRVTDVDGDEIEFVDWDKTSSHTTSPATSDERNAGSDSSDFGALFSDAHLERLGRGTRRHWCPWKRGITRYDVRPYRCLHVGDSVEAPVMYPDFRLHHHKMEESQLCLPARIAEVHGDQYVVEFSPALSAHAWWPGRLAKGTRGAGARVGCHGGEPVRCEPRGASHGPGAPTVVVGPAAGAGRAVDAAGGMGRVPGRAAAEPGGPAGAEPLE